MPLKLSVGVTRKVGLPGYCSVGASCGLELELPEGLLYADPEAFQERVHDAYVAAHRAVDDELARYHGAGGPDPPQDAAVNGHGGHLGNGANGPAAAPHTTIERERSPRPATAGQARALAALARRRGADLGALLAEEFGVATPEELSLREASGLIDRLQAGAAGGTRPPRGGPAAVPDS
jgi:hypothetical protein